MSDSKDTLDLSALSVAVPNAAVCTGNATTPAPPPPLGRPALGQRRRAPVSRRHHLTLLRPSMTRPGAEAAKPANQSPRHRLPLLRPSMCRPGAKSSKPGDRAPLLRAPRSRLDCRRPRRRS